MLYTHTTPVTMLDVDEYVELVGAALPTTPQGDEGPLPTFLAKYNEHGSLVAYWRMFGACGNVVPPALPAPQAYTCCTDESFPLNQKFVKSFVNVPRIQGTAPGCAIHTCYVPGGIVDELHRKVPEDSALTWQHIRIRHYQTKSLQEFIWKQQRGTNTSVCTCGCATFVETGFPHPSSKAGQEKRHRRYADWEFEQLERNSVHHCDPLY